MIDICIVTDHDTGRGAAKAFELMNRPLIPSGAKVIIKPNLVIASGVDSGAITDSKVVSAVIDMVEARGSRPVIAEGSWLGCPTADAFRASGMAELAKKRGVPLVDLRRDQYVSRRIKDGLSVTSVEIARTVANADFIINMPVPKAHSQTRYTGSLKNLKGCISDRDKRAFHRVDLDQAIVDLNKAIKPGLIVMSATYCSTRWEEGGDAVRLDTVIVGTDPVAVDGIGASLLGYGPRDIRHVLLASEQGIGVIDGASVLRHNAAAAGPLPAAPNPGGIRVPRGMKISQAGACSACLGAVLAAARQLDRKAERPSELRFLVGQKAAALEPLQSSFDVLCGDCAVRLGGRGILVPGCPPSAEAIVSAALTSKS